MTATSSQTANMRPVCARFASVIDILPDPPETWTVEDMPDEDHETVNRAINVLSSRGVIERVGTEYKDYGTTGTKPARIWKVSERAARLTRELTSPDETAPLPCGHTHITNPRELPEGTLRCGRCGATCDRSEVECQ